MVVFSDFGLELYKTLKLENDKKFNIEKDKNLFPLTLASVPMNASTSKTLPIQSNHDNNVLFFLLLEPVQLLCKLLGLVFGPGNFWVNHDLGMG